MLSNLSHYGLLKISGIDAKKLLQGQVTCDVDGLKESESKMGALCNPQGRIISLFHLFKINEDYYLLMLANMLPITIAALKKYAVFYKINMMDDSLAFSIFGGKNNATHKNMIMQIDWSNTRKVFIQTKNVSSHNEKNNWTYQNICEGIPTIYPETTGKFLPHEVNLHHLGALSFDKGCYTGQEIIARMHYRGKLKNHLYTVNIKSEKPFLPGSEIYFMQNEKPHACGSIVDVYQNKNDTYTALIVADENHAQNNHLFLNHNPDQFFEIQS